MNSRPNTIKHRPRGAEWLHFVRHRLKVADAAGRWYANIERDGARGDGAHRFLAWFEDRLRADESDIAAAWKKIERVTLWVRETPRRKVDDLLTDEMWEELTTLRRAVLADWREHHSANRLNWTTLHGLDSKGAGTPQGGRDADLLLGWVYDKDDESVKDFWMPRREERIEKAGKDVAKAVEALRGERPDLPTLDKATLPARFAEDGRSMRTARLLDKGGLDAFLQDADVAVGQIHDGTLAAFQPYLNELTGQALPTLEENQYLAKEVMNRAERFGVQLYIRAKSGDIKQVRVRAIAVKSLKNRDSPAALAGKFSTSTPGTVPVSVRDSVTFPQLIGARDLGQATRFFDEHDRAPQSPDAAE